MRTETDLSGPVGSNRNSPIRVAVVKASVLLNMRWIIVSGSRQLRCVLPPSWELLVIAQNIFNNEVQIFRHLVYVAARKAGGNFQHTIENERRGFVGVVLLGQS